jgi:hypothetical protein
MQKNVSRALSRRSLSHTHRLKPTTLLVTRAACGIAGSTRTFASSSSPNALSAKEYVSFGQAHVAKGLSRLVEDVIQSGQGSWVTMTSGKRLLDFTCGIGVTNLGELEIFINFIIRVIYGDINRPLSSRRLKSGCRTNYESRPCRSSYPCLLKLWFESLLSSLTV